MPVRRFLSLSMCALAVAGAPLAALASADRDAGRTVAPSSNEARFVLRGYADCLVRNDPRGVDSFLELSPFDPNFGRRGASISVSGCLVGGRLKFTAILLRGALFAVKYKRDFGATPPPVMIGAMDLAPAGTSPTAADGGAAIRFVVTAADCMAMRDLTGARALVLASIGSKAERESAGAVGAGRDRMCAGSGSGARQGADRNRRLPKCCIAAPCRPRRCPGTRSNA